MSSDTANDSEFLRKAEILDINKGWNDANQSALEELADTIASDRWKHLWACSRYKTYHNMITISLVLFSSALSAESLIPTDPDNLTMDISRRIFVYIITVLTFFQSFFKFQQISERHLQASSDLTKLYGCIQKQLILYRRNRIPASEFIPECLSKYDNVALQSPSINVIGLEKAFLNEFSKQKHTIAEISKKMIYNSNKEVIIEMPEQPQITPSKNKNKKICNVNTFKEFNEMAGEITDADFSKYTIEEIQEFKRKVDKKYNFELDRWNNN